MGPADLIWDQVLYIASAAEHELSGWRSPGDVEKKWRSCLTLHCTDGASSSIFRFIGISTLCSSASVASQLAGQLAQYSVVYLKSPGTSWYTLLI